MNQILYVEKNKKQSEPLDLNKVLLIFAIVLIVFGVSLLGKGVYAVVKNNEYSEKVIKAIPIAEITQEGQYANLNVKHVRAIETITYNWNGDEDTVINGNGRSSIAESIEIPVGNNTLYITIKDVVGKTARYNKEFSVNTGRDLKKPNIELNVVGNYLKLIVTDDTALNYVTYRWNENEEKKLVPNEVENAKIESSIEILKGRNKLTVIAVDSSNNTTTKTETYEGLTKPTVEVYVDGDSFLIIAKHENAVDRIEYTLNGQKYSIQYTPGPEMQYRQKMAEGYNKISIKAYSVDETVATKDGEYTYTKE